MCATSERPSMSRVRYVRMSRPATYARGAWVGTWYTRSGWGLTVPGAPAAPAVTKERMGRWGAALPSAPSGCAAPTPRSLESGGEVEAGMVTRQVRRVVTTVGLLSGQEERRVVRDAFAPHGVDEADPLVHLRNNGLPCRITDPRGAMRGRKRHDRRQTRLQ